MPDAGRPEKVLGPLATRFRQGRLPEPGDTAYPATANARLILHRSAAFDVTDGRVELRDDWVRLWARITRLGLGRQEHPEDGALAGHVAARRRAALRALAADSGVSVVTVIAEPLGAFVTGTGAGGIRDVGIELHGTYGWPVLSGTTLKGVAHASAREENAVEDEQAAVFGAPPHGDFPAQTGSVTFLDSLPDPGDARLSEIQVAEHVLTPHTRGYRLGGDEDDAGDDQSSAPKPPAEYVNPVPVPFLALQGGGFPVHLVGPEPEVTQAAQLLKQGLDEIGLGAKTTSGYGYFKSEIVHGIHEPPEPESASQSADRSGKKSARAADKQAGKRGGR